MDLPYNQWSYFNKLDSNFHNKTHERTFKRKISLLPSTSVPCSSPSHRPLENKQRRNYYSYFNDVYDSKVTSKRAGPHTTCENISSRKRKSFHDKRDARFVKATTARLIKRLNDPQLITIPENELLMKKRILEKTKELLQLIEFRQSYHKHLVEFKRLVSKLTKWITFIMKYTEDDRSEISKVDSENVNESIFGNYPDESGSDNSESTTEIKSFKYWFERKHRKRKRNGLTKGKEVQCTSMFSMHRKSSIHRDSRNIQWLGMSDKSTQLYCKRKTCRKKYHQKMNVQLQTTKENIVEDEGHCDSENQTSGTAIMPSPVSVAKCIPFLCKTPFMFSSPVTNNENVQNREFELSETESESLKQTTIIKSPDCSLPTVSIASCIPLLCKKPFFSSAVMLSPNSELEPSESEREWTSQEDDAFKEPKITINLKKGLPSLIVEQPQDDCHNNNMTNTKETLPIENRAIEIDLPNILSTSTSCQSFPNREKRKQRRGFLAIKNIFTTDFFDGNSTDNETVYCSNELEELCNKRSCTLTNTTSENDSIINTKKVRKFSRLPKNQTGTEPCEVKFKFNRNICTFSVNYNPSKVLNNLEKSADNEGLGITETEKLVKNTEEEPGEFISDLMLQENPLIDTSLLKNTTSPIYDDINNFSCSLSDNDVENKKNNDEVTSKNDLLSKSEPTNKITLKRKCKYNVKRKNKYIRAKKRRTSFLKNKKPQLKNKNREVYNKKPTSTTLPEVSRTNNVHETIADIKTRKDNNENVPERETSEEIVRRDIIETTETIGGILNLISTNIVDLDSKNDDILENKKNFDGTNSVSNSKSTQAVAVDVADSKNTSCNDIKKSEMTENDIDNFKELDSFNKRPSASEVASNNAQLIENKSIIQNSTGNLENKTRPFVKYSCAKIICEPNTADVCITLKLPEMKFEKCPNLQKSKTDCSRIPKWRSTTVPPNSKRKSDTVNKKELEKIRPKTQPDPRTSKILDHPSEVKPVATLRSVEIEDVPETKDNTHSIEVNTQITNQNIRRKIIKVSKILAQKRSRVCEEEILAKRRRTSGEERRFPSAALTRPTISSINKQNSKVRAKIASKYHMNCLAGGPVKVMKFSGKILASRNHLIDKEIKLANTSPPKKKQFRFQAEPYKIIDCLDKNIKFQSEDVFQQFRGTLCLKRFRKPVAQKVTNAATIKDKKPTGGLAAEQQSDSKTNELNNQSSSKINSDNPKLLSDSATQAINPTKRRVKRLGQPFSKYYLSRHPLWYTLKRRWIKQKNQKQKSGTTLGSKYSSSEGQANSSLFTDPLINNASDTKSELHLKTHSSGDNLNLPSSSSFECIKLEDETEITKTSDNVKILNEEPSDFIREPFEVTQGVQNDPKIKQNEISPENGQLAKALEDLKRYIASELTKGVEEKQRKTSREQMQKNNSEEMFKSALKTLHSSSEKKQFRINIDQDQSSIIDGNTASFSSFTNCRTQSLGTISTSESHKSVYNNSINNNDNEFKISFTSEKVRDLIKKSCRTTSRIPVPVAMRKSTSEQNLRVNNCPKNCTKLSSSSTHSICSTSAKKHHPSMMCCNQLDTCSIFLFEVARHSREWSKWVRQIFSGFNKFTSFIKGIKDDDVKLEHFYLKEWREFTAMVDKMLASWRQYSKEVKKVTEHAIRKFKRIDAQCCPKCLEDGIISDRSMMREVAQKLIDAITTAELWRTWLDDIMKQASVLVDIQPNDKHRKDVVDYSKHTYNDMVQTFSQIAFCIGEASKVIQKIDISELNK